MRFANTRIKISRHKRGHRWEALCMNAMAECLIDGKKMGEILLTDLSATHIAQWRDERLKSGVGIFAWQREHRRIQRLTQRK